MCHPMASPGAAQVLDGIDTLLYVFASPVAEAAREQYVQRAEELIRSGACLFERKWLAVYIATRMRLGDGDQLVE